jgi:hypothetical protein
VSARLLGKSGLAAVACLLASASPAAAQDAKPLPAIAPTADDALTEALEEGELTEAEYALERGRSLFQLPKVEAEFGHVERAGARDATLILRDLALRLRALPPDERAAARSLLARPDGGGVPVGNGWTAPPPHQAAACGTTICVHWVESTADAPQGADGNPATIPPWVTTTQSVFDHVWAQQVGALGYKTPLPDHRPVGDPRLDIYLDDLGVDQVFGYCTTDDPRADDFNVFAVSAYCVVDNDYAAVQYGTTHTPQEFLQVTAAHEFHHAVQFAYDWLEDPWLMEGTATNMEETIYPAVDDNLIFLRRASQFGSPAVSLDRGGLGDFEYGSWIFWRYLQEKVARGNPAILREIWDRADAQAVTDPDDYSLRAVSVVLRARGKLLADEYARFGVANRLRAYLDGGKYPATRTFARHGLGPRVRTTRWRSWRFNHLTMRFFSFTPGPRVGRFKKLGVEVDLTLNGARATLVSYYKSGKVEVRPMRLGSLGNGFKRISFGRGVVRKVDLVLSNGSSRFRSCFQDFDVPVFSCLGVAKDDRRVYRYRATLR